MAHIVQEEIRGGGVMVHIVDNWYIDADDSNYILIEWAGKKQVNKKTGVESMQSAKYRYYNKIDTALEQLVAITARRAIASSKSIQEMLETVKQQTERVVLAFTDVTGIM